MRKEIERLLGQLHFEFRERTCSCTPSQLADLGRAFNPAMTDDTTAQKVGTNQFKTTLTDLRRLFRTEKWLRNNCLVAVAASSNDGTSGLQGDDSSAATRKEIERFANIIFATTPKQREFWLGKLPGVRLRQELLREIDTAGDSLRFYFLGDNWKNRVEHVGAKEAYDPQGLLIV